MYTPSQQLELNTWLSSISSDRYCCGSTYKYIAYSWINIHTIQNDPLFFQSNLSNFNIPPTTSAPYKLSASNESYMVLNLLLQQDLLAVA